MPTKSMKLCYALAPWLLAPLACGSENPEDDTSGEHNAGAELPQPARMSCGNIPILIGDYWTRPAPAECVSCVEANCCAQAEACRADETCSARQDCYARCGYAYECRLRCNDDYPATSLGQDLGTCRSDNCPQCAGIDQSCLGQPLPVPSTATRQIRFRFVYFGSASTPFDNTHVRVCKTEDVECAAPLSEATTDADGWVDVELPTGPGGLTAYLELTGLAIAPTLLFPRWFDAETIADSLGFSTVDLPTFNALTSGLRAPDAVDDPSRGLLVATVRSCGVMAMAGMTLASSNADASTVQVYDESNFPSATATMTDGKGVGVHFANHPAGVTTVTATNAETGAHYGSLDVVVRAGFFSVVASIPPSP